MLDFFYFMSELRSSTFQANSIDPNVDFLKLIKGIYQEIQFPINFKPKNGNRLCDVLDTGYPGFYLISERMKTVLEENHLTGWKVFPIRLYDKKDNEINGYHGFSITGNCGPTFYKSSGIIEKRLAPHGPLCKYYKGIFIDKWDGTDFFTPDGTYQKFITRRAADILRKNEISNLNLKNLAEMEVNVCDVKPGSRIED